MNHGSLVYKVDNLVQNSLLSSLVLTLIQNSIHWPTLRSWVVILLLCYITSILKPSLYYIIVWLVTVTDVTTMSLAWLSHITLYHILHVRFENDRLSFILFLFSFSFILFYFVVWTRDDEDKVWYCNRSHDWSQESHTHIIQ